MNLRRRAGVLLHPTSLPGNQGIGGLGPPALEFLDFLAKTGQTLWQVLPLGPVGYGNSPYAPFSSFAGNELLIDLGSLVAEGDLEAAEVGEGAPARPVRVDYEAARRWKPPLLERAAQRFLQAASPERRAGYEAFCAESAGWLEDYALFMCLKERSAGGAIEQGSGGAAWYEGWDEEVASRSPSALSRLCRQLRRDIEIVKVLQYFFETQWADVRARARERGVAIVGDLPAFPAPHSSDVWAHRELFTLDGRGRPRFVAGVPPDYFSPTGQRWGNPLFDWRAMEEQGFRWWIERLAWTMRRVDIVRIDHFRGYEAYWEIPADAPTAATGRWVAAPGERLFAAAGSLLGELPLIAEDLGIITPEVVALRERLGFPGMRVLQFAFGGAGGRLDAANPFLPHNYAAETVAYTGTHDNDTTLGWYRSLPEETQSLVRRYLARDGHDISWDLVRLAHSSVARYAIVQMQDLLSLGSEARMNVPSTVGGGNWAWRLSGGEMLDEILLGRLREMTELYGRA